MKRLNQVLCLFVSLSFATSTSAASSSPILQTGTQDYETDAFKLTLDKASQVATSITVKAGGNAGSTNFETLLMTTVNRTDDGFNVSAER